MPTKRTIGSDASAAPGCAVIGLSSCYALRGPSRSHEAPFLHHRPRVVERFRKTAHQLVDLGFADDERRAERDDVARHVAQNRAVVLRASHEERADTRLRVEALPGRLVANKLDGAD